MQLHPVGIDNTGNHETYDVIEPRYEAAAAEGILQLQGVVIRSISGVTVASQDISVHLPSKVFDIYAVLELEPVEICADPPPDEPPLEEQLRDADEEGVEIAGAKIHEMIMEDT
jgi:hypothetical protein